jgi:hypothetical protein
VFEFSSLFDYDGNNAIDLADLAAFLECMAGPGMPPSPVPPPDTETCLDAFDAVADEDVDAADFVEMMLSFGAGL